MNTRAIARSDRGSKLARPAQFGIVDGTPAPEEARPGGRFALPVLLSLVFLSIIGYGLVVPLLPFYATLFGAAPWQVTLMFSAYALGQLGGELVWGPLADRLGRKPVLLLTILCSAGGYLLLAGAPNIWVAIAARGATGFFSGNLSTVQSYMVDVSPRERLSGRLGLVSAATGIALVVGPAFGGLLARPGLGAAGFALPVLVAAGVCVVAGAAALLLLRESHAAADRNAPKISRTAQWRIAAADPVLARLLGVSFLAYVAFAVLNATLGLWGQGRFGWTPREVGGLMAVTGASMAITQIFITGRVAKRLGESATVMLGMGLAGIAFLFLPLIPHPALSIPCLVLVTVGMSLYQPPTISLVSDRAGERRGAMLGVNSAAGALGRVSGPLGAGVLISGATLGAPFFLASASMLLGGVLAFKAGRQLGRSR